MSYGGMLRPAFLVTVGLLSVSAIGMSAAIKAYGLHLQKSEIHPPGNRQISTVSRETPHWVMVGSDQILDEDTVKTLGTNNYVSRVYGRKDSIGTREPMYIEFHSAYYTGGIDTVPHVPERCMVGGGWRQTQGTRTLALDLDTTTWVKDEGASRSPRGVVYTVRTLPAPYSDAPGTRVRLPYGITPESPIHMRISEFENPETGAKLYAGYFFIANGGVSSSAEGVRTLAFDLTSDYAYYLKVQFSSTYVSTAEDLATQSAGLLGEIIAELVRCVPDWVSVDAGLYPADNPRGKKPAVLAE